MSILGGISIVLLAGAVEALEVALWPGVLAGNVLNPVPHGVMRKDPDPLWFIFGNIAFWSLVVFALITVVGRLARRGKRHAAAM